LFQSVFAGWITQLLASARIELFDIDTDGKVFLVTGYSGGKKMGLTSLKLNRCFLPHFMLYVAWSLCFLIIMASTGVTIYIGITYEPVHSAAAI